MLFKITSDGTSGNTRITDLSNGKLVGKVQKIVWEVSVDEPLAKCSIEIVGVPLEIDKTNVNEIVYKNSKTIELSKQEIFEHMLSVMHQTLMKINKRKKEGEKDDNLEEFLKYVNTVKDSEQTNTKEVKESKGDEKIE